MVSMTDEGRTRVNGALLAQYNGQPVVLMATVDQVDPSGMSVSVTASDNQRVQVKLQEPLQENLEGVIEIHGISQGRQLLCQNYITFPPEMYQDFDMSNYDEAIRLIHSVDGNLWKNN